MRRIPEKKKKKEQIGVAIENKNYLCVNNEEHN